MYLAFRQTCTNDEYYDKTAHAQTDPHVSIWRESAFGGNLHLAGTCALTRMRKQTFSMVLKYHKDDKNRY